MRVGAQMVRPMQMICLEHWFRRRGSVTRGDYAARQNAAVPRVLWSPWVKPVVDCEGSGVSHYQCAENLARNSGSMTSAMATGSPWRRTFTTTGPRRRANPASVGPVDRAIGCQQSVIMLRAPAPRRALCGATALPSPLESSSCRRGSRAAFPSASRDASSE